MVRLIAHKRSTPCYGPIAGRSSYTPLRSAGRHRARGLAGQRSSTAEPPPRDNAEHHHRLLLFATGAARRVAATQHRRWLPSRAGPWADHAAADEPPGGRSSAAAPRRSCRPRTRHDHRWENPGTVPRTWAAREYLDHVVY